MDRQEFTVLLSVFSNTNVNWKHLEGADLRQGIAVPRVRFQKHALVPLESIRMNVTGTLTYLCSTQH